MKVVLLILGSLVSGVVLMIWGFIFWSASPFPATAMSQHAVMDQVVERLEASSVKTGVYFYPPAAEVPERQRGPFIEMFYVPDVQYMGPSTFVKGYIHFVGSAILAGILMLGLGNSLATYGSRVSFVFMVGLLAVFALHFSNPIWFHYPWNFAFMVAGYDLVLFLLIGLVMGAFIRPSPVAVAKGASKS